MLALSPALYEPCQTLSKVKTRISFISHYITRLGIEPMITLHFYDLIWSSQLQYAFIDEYVIYVCIYIYIIATVIVRHHWIKNKVGVMTKTDTGGAMSTGSFSKTRH